MWYRLALVVKIGRDINSPQQKRTAIWTSLFGKKTLMTSRNYGHLLSSLECHSLGSASALKPVARAPTGSLLKEKMPVRTVILSLASVTQ